MAELLLRVLVTMRLEAAMAGVGDLPGLHEASESTALKFGEDAGGGYVEGAGTRDLAGVEIVLKIDVVMKCAAADFAAVDAKPVGLVELPDGGREPIGFSKNLVIKGRQAAQIAGQNGWAELGFHEAWGILGL